MSEYICPNCDEDLDEWFDKNKLCSPYSGKFNCPKCKVSIKCEYEEMWDGEEEHNYFFLSLLEETE